MAAVRDVEPRTAVLGVRCPRAGELRAEHHPLYVSIRVATLEAESRELIYMWDLPHLRRRAVGPILLQEPVEHDQQGHHPSLHPGWQLDRLGLNEARRSCWRNVRRPKVQIGRSV